MTEWRSVSGYEGFYEVSSDGQVRGCQRTVGAANGKTKVITSKPLKPTVQQPSGHLHVSLYRERKRYHRAVHRAVLEAFVGPCPDGMEACHRDGNPANNSVENLYWGTRASNVADSLRHGTHFWAKRTHCKNGHEFTPENTFDRGNGRRGCYTCNRKWKAEYKARQREKGAAA